MKEASAALEAWLDKCHEVAREHGFPDPSAFREMRTRYGTLPAVIKLVTDGTMQSGFQWCRDHGILDYSVEAAVIKFAAEFDPGTVDCARWRLETVRSKGG